MSIARPLPDPSTSATGPDLRQWRTLELAFTAQRDCGAPLDDWNFQAVFTAPDGRTMAVPGFADGGRRWLVRFRPDLPGAWRWTTTCDPADSGLHGLGGSFTVALPAADEANLLDRHGGILQVGDGGRHIAYSDSTPFFWLGDTWWFCPSQLVPWDGASKPGVTSAYRLLVDTRAAQGYNTVHMAFLGGAEAGAGDWTLALDGRLDPDYWARIDVCLGYANRRGLVPVIGIGFHTMLNAPTAEQLQRLWRYVLARYGAHAVTFLICGEYNLASGKDPETGRNNAVFSEIDAARTAKMLALGAWIKAHDPWRRAITIHPWANGCEGTQAWSQPWYDITLIQGGHGADGPPSSDYRRIWARSPPRPLLEGEVTYEGIFGHSDLVVRRNAWKAVCSGSAGFTYGAQGLWYPNQNICDRTFAEWGPILPWWDALERPGAAQMGHLRRICERLPWWRMAPLDPVLPDGSTTEVWLRADAGHILGYVSAGVAPTARIAVPASGRWRCILADPRSGETRPATDAGAATGVVILPARPDDRDWVVLLSAVQP